MNHKQYNPYYKNKRGNIDIIEDIEILKLKLIRLEDVLDGKLVFDSFCYLNSLSYYSYEDNFDINTEDNPNYDKDNYEGLRLIIWKYNRYSTTDRVIVKIGYKIDGIDKYTSNVFYSYYTTLDIAKEYFQYIFNKLVANDSISPIKFCTEK